MHHLLRLIRGSSTSDHSSSYSNSGSTAYSTTTYFSQQYIIFVFTQLLPFLILLGLPALALLGRAHWHPHFPPPGRVLRMVLEALLGVPVPFAWLWGNGNSATKGEDGSGSELKRRRGRKDSTVRERSWRRRRRRRNTQNGNANAELSDVDKVDEAELDDDEEDDDDDDDEDLFYPGLVNISGTYCFLNSVLQATASLAYLQPHLDAIHTRAVDLDVPTPVVDTLQETLHALNTPNSSRHALRPVPIINALSQPAAGTRGRSKLFASREHQDAQELFQLLSECIKSEVQAVEAEAQRDRGLGGFASSPPSSSSFMSSSTRSIEEGDSELSASAGVFDGLTANRRSCVACGYTEAVMHFAFATWSLALPSGAFGGVCSLQECLAEYTRLELLTDCVCRRCSMRATHARLREEAERLAEAIRPPAAACEGGGGRVSQYKKKKAREARKLERLVGAAIEEGRIEEDVKGVKMERVVSPASTKQAMIARPPKILVLHLNRSIHFGGSYSSRNPIRIIFPEILDLTPYTTSGQLSIAPSMPISTPPPSTSTSTPIPRSTTPTQALYTTPRVLYRLSAVVVHYGAHSFGHYVCFRRKPRLRPTTNKKEERIGMRASPAYPQMPCPFGCECGDCTTYGPIRDFLPSSSPPNPSSSSSSSSSSSNKNSNSNSNLRNRATRPGKGWLRISDDAVEECGLERVLSEGSGAFLLFYERVRGVSLPWGARGDGKASGGVIGQRESVLRIREREGMMMGREGGMGEERGLGSIYQHLRMKGTPRSSEETVRPVDVHEHDADARVASGSGSSSSASSSVGGGGGMGGGVGVVRPRVVRRTTAGRRERSRGKEREGEGGPVAVTGTETLIEGRHVKLSVSEPNGAAAFVGEEQGQVNGERIGKERPEEAENQRPAAGTSNPKTKVRAKATVGAVDALRMIANTNSNLETEKRPHPEPKMEREREEEETNELSESIVRVERPSPPRTPSPGRLLEGRPLPPSSPPDHSERIDETEKIVIVDAQPVGGSANGQGLEAQDALSSSTSSLPVTLDVPPEFDVPTEAIDDSESLAHPSTPPPPSLSPSPSPSSPSSPSPSSLAPSSLPSPPAQVPAPPTPTKSKSALSPSSSPSLSLASSSSPNRRKPKSRIPRSRGVSSSSSSGPSNSSSLNPNPNSLTNPSPNQQSSIPVPITHPNASPARLSKSKSTSKPTSSMNSNANAKVPPSAVGLRA